MSGGLGDNAASQFALVAGEEPSVTPGKLEEPDHSSSNWYFSRDEIEKHSPSRKDGIDIKKETYFRKSYCTFLQDLGMRLKVPQVTIATAIVFCHRFFLRQSHARNDRHMVATVCMFLAGKVEETPRPLRDVILVSYEIRHKKDPAAVQRIKQKDVYEEQKDLVLVGERLVLTTLGFDLNIHHPYKPLVTAIKKYKVAQHALAQVAWNFVNDGLRTSLCLQFKPHHIAAGAIFLAAKFLKVKLPSDGEKVWWQEFEVTPRQLEEVSNQMLELYEQNKAGPGSRMSDPNGSAGTSVHEKPGMVFPRQSDAVAPLGQDRFSQGANASGIESEKLLHEPKEEVGAATSYEHDASKPTKIAASDGHTSDLTFGSEEKNPPRNSDYFGKEEDVWAGQNTVDDSMEGQPTLISEVREELEPHVLLSKADELEEQTKTEAPMILDDRVASEFEVASGLGAQDGNSGMPVELDNVKPLAAECDSEGTIDNKAVEALEKPEVEASENKRNHVDLNEVNKDRVKAALEKRRKTRGEGTDTKFLAPKMDVSDEEELLERELENGVEAAAEAERMKQDQSDSKSKSQQDGDTEVVEAEKLNEEKKDSKMKFQIESSDAAIEADRLKQEEKDRKDKSQQESGVEAVSEKSRKDSKTKNKYRSMNDPLDGKKERGQDPEGSLKRKRSQDEMLSPSDRKWSKSSERTDWSGDLERTKLNERTEQGELRNGHEQVHSPRIERRFQQPQAADKSSSPLRQRDHAAHSQHPRREGAQENKHRHGYNRDHYHHHSHHHQQYRSDDRDRHYHKDRDWQEREQKKPRHSYGK
ncbi:hypothetical protein O6H91_17G058700 [Diphasiastrum complanatum]|uniref:Uncharacterized protein n=3 Tax=Diphasiastrum complanatum TaxID=34168 RepID=A0ACC2B772_DIPCM|nr:hypothetical protein O6H91_17G058700 [Diphasiastrum complanatum]KAJ7525612.1 hypothetical protein O6H91_17G058700 [Diphasiastrum complanatum]KAJ7525613.1 hypothetical protein O6H91_17G058700 [Diphasiastrum complanatum]